MKQFKTLLVAIALVFGAASFTQAQGKVAHINTSELVAAMPEYKSAQAEMEKLGKSYDADYKAMVTELQSKMKTYEAEAPQKTDAENAKRMEEVQGMQQSIQQFQAGAQQKLAQKEVELLKPIQEKARGAILKVAKAQGFQYVLDEASLIMADGKDLLADVKKELGL